MGRLLELTWLRRAAAAAVTLLLIGVVAAYAVPLPARLSLAPSTVVTFADGSPAHVFLTADEKYRLAVPLGEVDPDYLAALLRFEDHRFRYHPGVDPLALLRALALNLWHGRVISGGSTITMQLARLLEPRPRTLRSKAVEALRALQLEVRLSKDEILSAYLAFLPFGGNLEGLGAASHAYFGHGARDLSADEIATLLAVPQDPTRRHPRAGNAERLRQARNRVAARLLDQGLLPRGPALASPAPEALLAQVRATPVPVALRALPRLAPHAARWVREQDPGPRIRTTLDRGLQRLAAERLARAHAGYRALGIHNGSTVILDHRSGDVRALVGNFDFWDVEHGGQIAGFATPRSPGSALKPFIYALGIDQGLALPGQLVPDIPVAWGTYSPENYDGGFAGLVRLEDALSRSLNVPFVNLLNQVGVERFLGTLQAAGARHLDPTPGHYGLSAAIGAVEITPLEMAGLYAMLAADGRSRPLRWRASDPPAVAGEGPPLISPGAAHLTRRALARRDRPDFPERRRHTGAPAQVHWKTGTSYGHRDAWAVGSGPRYTVAVWLGNFDNQPSVDLVGAPAAGPLLFDLLEAVADRTRPAIPDRPPPDLKAIAVCAYSGFRPGPACPHRRRVLARRARVPTRPCPYHAAIDVDADTGRALHPGCRAGRKYHTRSFLVWPATIERWLGDRHRWLPQPPILDPRCTAPTRGAPPSIVSPPAGQVAVLIPGVPPGRQEIPLEAESLRPGARLSWFVDGAFLGTVAARERLWWTPRPGSHELLVMDQSGASAVQRLKVWRRR